MARRHSHSLRVILVLTSLLVLTLITTPVVAFSISNQQTITTQIYFSGEQGYPDVVREAIVYRTGPVTQTPFPPTDEVSPITTEKHSDESGLVLPLIGTIDLSGQSLLVSTLLISFVDGFNPCSVWVLSILLSLTLHTGSRKKVIIVGSVFLLVTAAIYALFIAGIFTVLRFISFIGWIQIVVALIALGFGLINIKDYFWFQKGLSLTISSDKKPGIYKRIRKVLQTGDSTWSLIGATVVLAAGISLVEFSCTAGFPVIWSNVMSSQGTGALTFALLLLVYMVVYLFDEMGLFMVAVFTLRSTRLEEKHGRILKLIGGMLMLTLAIVMLIEPSIMNDIASTLVVFAIALGLTGLVLLFDRVILPLTVGNGKSE